MMVIFLTLKKQFINNGIDALTDIQKLEITINADGMFLRSEVVSDNMYNNIDLALPKLEKQTGVNLPYTEFIKENIMKFIVDTTKEYNRVYENASRYPDVALVLLRQAFSNAIYENKKGLVSYDVTKNGEELLNGNYLFALSKSNQNYPINDFNSYITSLKKLKQQGYNFDLKQQIVNLYKIAVFDSLTAQSDRHISNVFFIVNKKDKTLKVAPLIDNELAFNIENESATLYYNYYINFKIAIDKALK